MTGQSPPTGGQPYQTPGYRPWQYPPPPQYPPQAPPPGYPPQAPQYPPPPYQQQYQQAPPPQYPPQQYPPQHYQPQPVVIPIEGKGVAKLAARMSPRSLIIGPEGLTHQHKKGAFRIAWPELRRVIVTTAYHQNTTQLFAPKTWRVRLIMDTADPGFPQRHPELARLQGKYGGTGPGSYGVPLGPVTNIVEPLAQALSAFGVQVFGGVINEGQVIGFGYL